MLYLQSPSAKQMVKYFSEDFVKYSLDEQIVGEWIDGKPVYRKTFELKSGNSVQTLHNLQDVSDLNIKNVIKFDSIINFNISGNSFHPMPFHNSTGATTEVHISAWINNNVIVERHTHEQYNSGLPIIVILEYTKTTD